MLIVWENKILDFCPWWAAKEEIKWRLTLAPIGSEYLLFFSQFHAVWGGLAWKKKKKKWATQLRSIGCTWHLLKTRKKSLKSLQMPVVVVVVKKAIFHFLFFRLIYCLAVIIFLPPLAPSVCLFKNKTGFFFSHPYYIFMYIPYMYMRILDIFIINACLYECALGSHLELNRPQDTLYQYIHTQNSIYISKNIFMVLPLRALVSFCFECLKISNITDITKTNDKSQD